LCRAGESAAVDRNLHLKVLNFAPVPFKMHQTENEIAAKTPGPNEHPAGACILSTETLLANLFQMEYIHFEAKYKGRFIYFPEFIYCPRGNNRE